MYNYQTNSQLMIEINNKQSHLFCICKCIIDCLGNIQYSK